MSTPNEAPQRSEAEEMANTLTHGLGFVLSVLGAVAIARAAPALNHGTAIACCVFVVTLIVLYAVSTLSHFVRRSRLQNRLRAWDQGAVYLLIAGTYTPLLWGESIPRLHAVALTAVWAAAVAGFVSKVALRHQVNDMRPHGYILLGWIPAVFTFYSVPSSTLLFIVLGGVSYTVGTVFLKMDNRAPYLHAAWHLFVVVGSACHYYAIYDYVIAPRIS